VEGRVCFAFGPARIASYSLSQWTSWAMPTDEDRKRGLSRALYD